MGYLKCPSCPAYATVTPFAKPREMQLVNLIAIISFGTL